MSLVAWFIGGVIASPFILFIAIWLIDKFWLKNVK